MVKLIVTIVDACGEYGMTILIQLYLRILPIAEYREGLVLLDLFQYIVDVVNSRDEVFGIALSVLLTKVVIKSGSACLLILLHLHLDSAIFRHRNGLCIQAYRLLVCLCSIYHHVFKQRVELLHSIAHLIQGLCLIGRRGILLVFSTNLIEYAENVCLDLFNKSCILCSQLCQLDCRIAVEKHSFAGLTDHFLISLVHIIRTELVHHITKHSVGINSMLTILLQKEVCKDLKFRRRPLLYKVCQFVRHRVGNSLRIGK